MFPDFNLDKIPYRKFRWLFHAIFWICAVSVYTIIYGSHHLEYYKEFLKNIYALPIKMTATYSLLYLLIPKLLYRRKYTQFFIFFFLSAFLFSTLEWKWLSTVTFHNYDKQMKEQEVFFIFPVLMSIIHIYPIAIAAASIKIIKNWYRNTEETNKLTKEKLEAELKFLKSQIHPHFLFNTLNNLYALTLKKSDRAPEIVLKLSGLLSYILYESNVEKASLDKELKIIENYIELECLRYGDKLTFTKDFKGNTSGMQIAPLLLLPFLENSFKHGANSGIKNPKISFFIKIEGDTLNLLISNSKAPDSSEPAPINSGIGLSNVKRRLELLYQNKYRLHIFDEKETYEVRLTINLK